MRAAASARALSGEGVPGDDASRTGGTRNAARNSSDLPKWPVVAFLVGLIIPWMVPVGPMYLSIYRIVLIVFTIPAIIMWMRGDAGRWRFADFAFILYGLWCVVSLMVIHGFGESVETAGILVVESLGAYFLARIYIRNVDDFRKMVRLAATVVLVLLPFALIEALTGKKILLEVYGLIMRTVPETYMYRSGVWRAQGPFDHPIVFGLNCASVFALSFVLKTRNFFTKICMVTAIGLTAFLSLSSAPIAALFIQIILLGWNWVLKANRFRWYILLGFVFAGYLVVELGSNQTPVAFYISHFTFDQQTGWYRIAIWDAGKASVAAHMWMGIGLADWARPAWMHSGSVDNFWLLTAMRHGLPALILLWAGMLALVLGVVGNRNLDREQSNFRTAFIITIFAYLFVGSTVHFWNATYSLFFFFLGSGIWMIDAVGRGSGEQLVATTASRRIHARKAEQQSERAARHENARRRDEAEVRRRDAGEFRRRVADDRAGNRPQRSRVREPEDSRD